MSVNTITASTRVYPSYQELGPKLGFTYPIPQNFRTLSRRGAQPGDVFEGFLYVPDIPLSGPNAVSKQCNFTQSGLLPTDVTRLANLPNLPKSGIKLIALAPWTDPDCTLAYLDAATRDQFVEAFLVYQPGSSSATPPASSSSAWDLDDGGKWKSQHDFPVYAIPPVSGGQLAIQLGHYSGNLSTIPHSHKAQSKVAPTDIVRVYAQLTTSTNTANQLPSLWVFLLVVLGVLVVIMGSTSGMMHWTQRRRRADLQRRVEAGQVDLATLGITTTSVPQETLDKFPIEVYNPGDSADVEKAPVPQPPTPVLNQDKTSGPISPTGDTVLATSISLPVSPVVDPSSPVHSSSHSTCAICIDDFEPHKTQIRVLPCHHAFHPDCIDSFLLQSSSLCPLCKQSVLPKGHVPEITNYMVRRERLVRRMEETRDAGIRLEAPPQRAGAVPARAGGVSRNSFLRDDARLGSMAYIHARYAWPSRRASATPATTREAGRNPEWARRRAAALVGINPDQQADGEEEDRRPRWRRAVATVFPSMR